ncbi:alginate lyase family protein [Mucilaginibacter sp. L3T2-6]|uniref:alginate lyase family protein n=1 Tax=Mucilaginibacter sp. L3T2-6 TaxID=3062491 RepID=UPI002676AE01|nr:alginate lyase family protein [Mucilaginibacter sp. L3T2-6]MDO3643070.1 alginate lyase family protein [Mucilaginibacter sp. L3T2-6]MDV6215837.1 alginate lyase family protein [Mucilaginibacter sp. L3T2-6]
MIKLNYLKILACLLLTAWHAPAAKSDFKRQVESTLRPYILHEAAWALTQQPLTITSEKCARSMGSKNDFYSEGDYWWPDPANPDGPYLQKDGLTNPANFTAHRLLMIRFSRIVGALASAYKLTHDVKYIKQAEKHIKAWFADSDTRMNPNLLYAQAIKGVATGRGIGIIDTIQLMEVAQGMLVMGESPGFDKDILAGAKAWFKQYLDWLTTHKYGKDEMNAKNNHGTCWVMQVACFARFVGDKKLLKFCSNRYKNVLLPAQMAADGSFPLELKRTKPYGYSIFNLDAMATICNVLSGKQDNLWLYETPDGRSIKEGIKFLYPFLTDKNKWPYPKDVMYWDNWPVAGPALLFGAMSYHNPLWLKTWLSLNHDPREPEIIRNMPVRHPLIWLN